MDQPDQPPSYNEAV